MWRYQCSHGTTRGMSTRSKYRRVQVPVTPEVEQALDAEIESNAKRGVKLSDAAALVAIIVRSQFEASK